MARARIAHVTATLNARPPPPVGHGGPMARIDHQVAATLDAAPPARKRQTKEAASAQLSRCRVLLEAVDYASKVISGAGSKLERGAVKFGEATVICQRSARIIEGPPPPGSSDVQLMHASLGLIDATASVGHTLTQFGTMLNDEILAPLQKLYAQIEQDQERRRAGLVVLEQQEQLCSNALAESAKRKEKACHLLQVALKEVEDNGSNRGGGWLKMSLFVKKDLKVEQLAQQQTAAVEELALRTEEANLARLRRQEGADAFHAMLCEVDTLYKRLLQTTLSRCSRVWKDASQALQGMGEQLQTSSSALGLNLAGKAKTENSEEKPLKVEPEQEVVADAAEIAPQALADDKRGDVSKTDQTIPMSFTAMDKPLAAATIGKSLSAMVDSSSRYAILEEEEVAVQKVVGTQAAEGLPDFQAAMSSTDSADAVDAVGTVLPASKTDFSEQEGVKLGDNDGATTAIDTSAEVQALLDSIPDAVSEMSSPVAATSTGAALAHHAANNALPSISAAEVIVSAERTTPRQAQETGAAGGALADTLRAADTVTTPGPAMDAPGDDFYDSCDGDGANAATTVELKAEKAAAAAAAAAAGSSGNNNVPSARPTAAEEMTPAATVDASPKRLNRLLNVSVEVSQGPLGMKLIWPPGPVEVQEVIPGGWAAKSGILRASEIVLLDGLPVADMDEAGLRAALQVRPLCLAVRLPPADEIADRL